MSGIWMAHEIAAGKVVDELFPGLQEHVWKSYRDKQQRIAKLLSEEFEIKSRLELESAAAGSAS